MTEPPQDTPLAKRLMTFFTFLYEQYWHVDTFGFEHVPTSGPMLFVGNHSGTLPYDACMLKVALRFKHPSQRKLHFLVEHFMFDAPFLGRMMSQFEGVRATPQAAADLLEQGHMVAVFPEGVKGLGKLHKERYRLARFGRGGFVRAALKAQAPLIPVAFVGPEDIHPLLTKETFLSKLIFGLPYFPVTWTFPWLGPFGLVPFRSRWSIHILPPMDFSAYGPEAAEDRVLVHQLSLQVKELIQNTLCEQLAFRSAKDRIRVQELLR